MTRFVIHNHLPARRAKDKKDIEANGTKDVRDFRGVVNRDEEERLRDRMYKDTGITRIK